MDKGLKLFVTCFTCLHCCAAFDVLLLYVLFNEFIINFLDLEFNAIFMLHLYIIRLLSSILSFTILMFF